MRKRVRLFGIAAVASGVMGASAAAVDTGLACASARCTCATPERDGQWRTHTEAGLQRSRAVFLGTVDTVLSSPRRGRFRVVRWFKGGTADTVTVQEDVEVWGDSIRSSCAWDFRRVTTVLLFADARVDGTLHIGLCSLTRTREDADSILAYLGLGWAPVGR